MNVLDFVKNASDHNFFLQHSVVGFTSTSYPFLFFSLLAHNIRKLTQGCYRSIDLTHYELEQVKELVSMPFLGSSYVYWFGTIDELDIKKKKELLLFLQDYAGPHSLCFFSSEWKSKSGFDPIVLPSTIDEKQWKILYAYFFPAASENASMRAVIFKRHDTISLDAACLLMHYCSIMGRTHSAVFAQEWLDKILVPEKSLFRLSTYLFGKKAKEFFVLWQEISQDYPPQFWISFWSDQLFRAACFVRYARAHKFLLAKKIAPRLPFTFIKKDWQHYTAAELVQAHHALYCVDFNLKNGGSDLGFDLLYQRFFRTLN